MTELAHASMCLLLGSRTKGRGREGGEGEARGGEEAGRRRARGRENTLSIPSTPQCHGSKVRRVLENVEEGTKRNSWATKCVYDVSRQTRDGWVWPLWSTSSTAWTAWLKLCTRKPSEVLPSSRPSEGCVTTVMSECFFGQPGQPRCELTGSTARFTDKSNHVRNAIHGEVALESDHPPCVQRWSRHRSCPFNDTDERGPLCPRGKIDMTSFESTTETHQRPRPFVGGE